VQGRREEIRTLLSLIISDFAQSPVTNNRKGGLIGLAALAVGLGADGVRGDLLGEILPAVLQSSQDQDTRLRYYAVESLYNICKMARGAVLDFWLKDERCDLFDVLCTLSTDPEHNVRNAAHLLDRLVKDIVTEEARALQRREFVRHFLPKLVIRLRWSNNPYLCEFLLSWVVHLDSVPELSLVPWLPFLLDPLLRLLSYSCEAQEIRCSAQVVLDELFEEMHSEGHVVDVSACLDILSVWSYSHQTSQQDNRIQRRQQPRPEEEEEEKDADDADDDDEEEDGALNDSGAGFMVTTTIGGVDYVVHFSGPSSAAPIAATSFESDDSPCMPSTARNASGGSGEQTRELLVPESLDQHLTKPDGHAIQTVVSTGPTLTPSCVNETVHGVVLLWVLDLLARDVKSGASCFPALVASSLAYLSVGSVTIQELAAKLNTMLAKAVADTHGGSGSNSLHPVAVGSIMDVAITELVWLCAPLLPSPQKNDDDRDGSLRRKMMGVQSGQIGAVVCALDWILRVSQLERAVLLTRAQTPQLVAVLTELLAQQEDEIIDKVLAILQVLVEDSSNFDLLCANTVTLFRGGSSVGSKELKNKGQLILRRLAKSLGAHQVMVRIAAFLDHEPENSYAARIISAVAVILFTAPEFGSIRQDLRETHNRQQSWDTEGGGEGGGGGGGGQGEERFSLFQRLFTSFCRSPGASLALTLLAGKYDVALGMLNVFEEVEIQPRVLAELDRTAFLLETPAFTRLRFNLLRPAEYRDLYQALCTLLMLLPQGDAFAVLEKRLQAARHTCPDRGRGESAEAAWEADAPSTTVELVEVFRARVRLEED